MLLERSIIPDYHFGRYTQARCLSPQTITQASTRAQAFAPLASHQTSVYHCQNQGYTTPESIYQLEATHQTYSTTAAASAEPLRAKKL
ncbi:MAG: hypothetical protein ACI9DH_000082 [Halioglobus sp.]